MVSTLELPPSLHILDLLQFQKWSNSTTRAGQIAEVLLIRAISRYALPAK